MYAWIGNIIVDFGWSWYERPPSSMCFGPEELWDHRVSAMLLVTPRCNVRMTHLWAGWAPSFAIRIENNNSRMENWKGLVRISLFGEKEGQLWLFRKGRWTSPLIFGMGFSEALVDWLMSIVFQGCLKKPSSSKHAANKVFGHYFPEQKEDKREKWLLLISAIQFELTVAQAEIDLDGFWCWGFFG